MSTLVDRIREMVLSGSAAPGSKLDEQELAQRFDVSRTPVREALHQLASSGLIELRPRRGAYVATLSRDQRSDYFVAMSELEATCARLAAMSMMPHERRDLLRLHESMGELVAAGRVAQFDEANEELHSMVYRGAHNVVITDLTVSLRDRLRPHRTTQFQSQGRIAAAHAEHDVMVRAIATGDAVRAHSSMLHHLAQAAASFHEMVLQPPAEADGETDTD